MKSLTVHEERGAGNRPKTMDGVPEKGSREACFEGVSPLSISISSSLSTAESSENKAESASIPLTRFSARNASSKYDFVKVKVWLGDNADHYYVLSRFLLSRMLTVTKIPNHVAIKIALELKKLLIDNSLLDVSQSDLEANLFKLMERRGYGEEFINRYKMMTRFHHQRVPLVILVCGTASTGKSTISTQLAQRLNLPNVLQTDMVYELLRTSTDAPLAGTPVWAREFNSSEELITEFCRECRIVRKGLAGDLKKAMKDGKPIIIEGINLDPSIYLMDEEKREISTLLSKDTVQENVKGDIPSELPVKCTSAGELPSLGTYKESRRCFDESEGTVVNKSCSQVLDENQRNEESIPGEKDEGLKYSDVRKISPVNKQKPAVDPIIVPIVLKMAEFDHTVWGDELAGTTVDSAAASPNARDNCCCSATLSYRALLEEWISTRTFGEKCPVQDHDKLIQNLKTIQDYLCSFQSQGLTVVNISATTFPQTLDRLHNYLLECIERGVSAASTQKQSTEKQVF